MPRRQESLADLLILLPWWVAASLSAACGVASLKLGAYSQLLHIFTLVFAFLSAFSAFRAWRTRRDLTTRLTLESLATMDWKHFEDLMAEVFRREGFRVEESLTRGADGGIDLRLRRDGEKVVVQCKRWVATKPVGAPTLHQTFGLQNAEGAHRAIVVTTSRFTAEARSFARDQGIELIDGPGLLKRLKTVRSLSPAATPGSPAPPGSPSSGPAEQEPPRPLLSETTSPPACPNCRQPMVLRTAKRGPTPGEQFWGCSTFPRCNGKRPLKRAAAEGY